MVEGSMEENTKHAYLWGRTRAGRTMERIFTSSLQMCVCIACVDTCLCVCECTVCLWVIARGWWWRWCWEEGGALVCWMSI
jgi:hypothetical protein